MVGSEGVCEWVDGWMGEWWVGECEWVGERDSACNSVLSKMLSMTKFNINCFQAETKH